MIAAILALQMAIASSRLKFSPAPTLQNHSLTDYDYYYPSQSKIKPMTLREQVAKEIEQTPNARYSDGPWFWCSVMAHDSDRAKTQDRCARCVRFFPRQGLSSLQFVER